MDASELDRNGLRGYYLRELAAAADTAREALDRVARFSRHLAAEPEPIGRVVDAAVLESAEPSGPLLGDAVAEPSGTGAVPAVGAPARSDVPDPEPRVDPVERPVEPVEPVEPRPDPDPVDRVVEPAAPGPVTPPAPPPGGAHRADGTGRHAGRPPRPRHDPADPATVEVPLPGLAAWPRGVERVRRPTPPRRPRSIGDTSPELSPVPGPVPGAGGPPTGPGGHPARPPRAVPPTPPPGGEHQGGGDWKAKLRWYFGIP